MSINLAWIDLETTGLNKDTECILEIACIVTDEDYNWKEEYTSLVRPLDWQFSHMDKETIDFHIKTGLYQAIDEMYAYLNDITVVDEELSEILSNHVNDKGLIKLAGSGVSHFDIHFIKRLMPLTYKLLHHTTEDIGVVRRFLKERVHIEVYEPKLRHRAYSDVVNHIEQAKWMRDRLQMAMYRWDNV